MLLNFILALASLTQIAANTIVCKSKRVTSLNDLVSTSWVISRHRPVQFLIQCSALCVGDQRCVSYMYNKVIGDCILFAVVKTATDMSSAVLGYKYYNNCRASGYYGATCQSNLQCALPNTECRNGACRCVAGYSLDTHSKACIARCAIYGLEFEPFSQKFINANNVESLTGVDPESCQEVCRQATTYICRSVDTRTSPDVACGTANVTKLDVAASDWATMSTWITVHYQRHCSV